MHPCYQTNTVLSNYLPQSRVQYIESGVVRTGLKTIFCEIFGDLSRAAAILAESAATCLSVSGPYRCWLPVTNQISFYFILYPYSFIINYSVNHIH